MQFILSTLTAITCRCTNCNIDYDSKTASELCWICPECGYPLIISDDDNQLFYRIQAYQLNKGMTLYIMGSTYEIKNIVKHKDESKTRLLLSKYGKFDLDKDAYVDVLPFAIKGFDY